MVSESAIDIRRRSYLGSLMSLIGATSLAGCSLLDANEDNPTTTLSDERAHELANQFAPILYFDEHEKWFPTDPRLYETSRNGETVIDGFAALNDYTAKHKQSDTPPNSSIFYHAVRYEDSPLAVVQFWYYSAFDQFTTNFHWHDWEVLHVFVDLESGNPQLYVASSHSSRVPNNEFLDPEPEQIPRILSELGSHSSALSVNDVPDRFQRLPIDGTFADITNSAIEGIEDLANFPVAYGLPRDEGFRLPYLVPELNDTPVYDHDQLPSVDRSDLVTETLIVHSFSDLAAPPRDLPGRATGPVFQPANRAEEAQYEYDLIPSKELEHITEFTGPQLSFEFAIPEFGEDAIASHITTASVPWDQARYNNPAADISDPNHRAALADRYEAIGEPAAINTVIGRVTEAVTSDEAPEDEGLTTQDLPVEAIALLESDSDGVPTTGGIAILQDVPEGSHRLTVNAAGTEPHSETIQVTNNGTGPATSGIEGEIPLVARENAMKLEVNSDGTADELTDLAIEDDFAGRIYNAPIAGPDAVYLHQGGAFTAEVKDATNEIGAYRVNPADEMRVRIETPRTGKGSLAEYIADVSEESSAGLAAVDNDTAGAPKSGSGSGNDGSANAIQGLIRALDAVAEAARRGAEQANAGSRGRADDRLEVVQDRLNRVSSRLMEAAGDLPDDLERAIDHRLEQMRLRSNQALRAEKL